MGNSSSFITIKRDDITDSIKEGYLQKRSEHLKTYRRRWMVLSGNTMYSFKDPPDVDSDFHNATAVFDLQYYNIVIKSPSPFYENQFELYTSYDRNDRQFFLAESRDEMNDWIQCINNAIRNNDSINAKDHLSAYFHDEDIEEKKEENLFENKAHFVKIVENHQVLKEVSKSLDKLQIKSEMNVCSPKEVIAEHSFHDDRYNTNIIPIGFDPLISLHLDIPFAEWNINTQNAFLRDIASCLNVKPSQLVPVSLKNGSSELTVMVCNVITEQLPEVEKAAVLLTENPNLPNNWNLKSSELQNKLKTKLGKTKNENEILPVTYNDSHFSKAEKWFIDQAKSLRDAIMTSLQDCSDEYEISAVFVLDNDDNLNDFIKQSGWQNSKVLFHGTKLHNVEGILKGGFDDKYIGSATDPGWYGRGHYFTSYPQYSMPYCEANQFGQRTLIVSYVNLGNTFQVYDAETYYGKPLKSGYQSHYVKVQKSGSAVPRNELDSYTEDIYDEYIVGTGKRVLPRFCVTFTKKSAVVIWRDKKIGNAENSGILEKLKQSYVIYGAETTQDALHIIAKKKGSNKVYIITNGADQSDDFIKSIRNEQNIHESILVFTSTMEYEESFKTFNDITVTTSSSDVYEFVKKKLQNIE